MKKGVRIAVISFFTAIISIVFHNLIYGLFGVEEPFFFTISLLMIILFIISLFYIFAVFWEKQNYHMKQSFITGISFGLTSGIITTLGLIVGLNAGTHSKTAVIGGILTIAVADAFSDALGIHISQESEKKNTQAEIWESTISTFLTKFIFALTFVVPIIMFYLNTAIIISVVWGIITLSTFNFFIAKSKKENPLNMIMEHLTIAFVVIIITHLLGKQIGRIFN